MAEPLNVKFHGDVCEISYPDGKVQSFPADEVVGDADRDHPVTYREKYGRQYAAREDAPDTKKVVREPDNHLYPKDGEKKPVIHARPVGTKTASKKTAKAK